jgi:hypothetical protein
MSLSVVLRVRQGILPTSIVIVGAGTHGEKVARSRWMVFIPLWVHPQIDDGRR